MSKFDASSYSKYRILYPPQLFDVLKSEYFQIKESGERLRVLDLGAGTGLSAASFLDCFLDTEVVLVEPDSAMLQESKQTLQRFEVKVERLEARAEEFKLSVPVDLVLVGSAWHWMNATQTLESLLSSVKPGGVVFIFEYQFPKAKGPIGLELNEWARRNFNLKWKPETQKPRGSFFEITEPIRAHPEFSEIKRVEIAPEENLSQEQFLGIIISQSRFLDYEKRLTETSREFERDRMREESSFFWKSNSHICFQYRFDAYAFHRRWV